jgi:hypothetical protein
MSRKPVKQYGRLSEHTLLDIIYVLDKNENYIAEIIRYDGLHSYFLTEYVTSTIHQYSHPTPIHYFKRADILVYNSKPYTYKRNDNTEYPLILNDVPERECYYYIHKHHRGIPHFFGDLVSQEYNKSSLHRIDIDDPTILYI